MKNKVFTFAAFTTRTIFKAIVCVVIFIATNTALYAVNNRLPNFDGCCAAKPVIVLVGTEKGSLSSFRYFNFSFMTRTMKDYGTVNNSICTVTPAGAKSEPEQFFTQRNVKLFKNLLKDAESYSYYLKSLWVFRDLLEKKWYSEGELTSNPIFPLLETINDLIGCLYVDGIFFDNKGDAYRYNGNRIEYLTKNL